MRWLRLCLRVALLVSVTCGGAKRNDFYSKAVVLTVKNPIPLPRIDEPVLLDVRTIKEREPAFNPKAFVLLADGKEVASQANDLDADGQYEAIVAVLDFAPNAERALTLRYAPSGVAERSYAKRSYAELSVKSGGRFIDRKYVGGQFINVRSLRVPPEHTDHSEFIRYEGPGWESDRIGYRFYLDWRNAIDLFGKKVSHIVLPSVGQDGFNSYHQMAIWGMDILKVGESLGIGSVGMWLDGKAHRVSTTDSVLCEVVLDGPVQSLIRTKYFGWQVSGRSYDLVSELSIMAGSRITTHSLSATGDPPNLCTGIVKDPSAGLFSATSWGGWAYLATYGKQSLANDSLGMAIIFNQNDLIESTEDEHSHIVVLRPQNGRLVYHFLAAWQQEPGGIKTKEKFVRYLGETLQRLEQPVAVTY